jgi:hypothetical protein
MIWRKKLLGLVSLPAMSGLVWEGVGELMNLILDADTEQVCAPALLRLAM